MVIPEHLYHIVYLLYSATDNIESNVTNDKVCDRPTGNGTMPCRGSNCTILLVYFYMLCHGLRYCKMAVRAPEHQLGMLKCSQQTTLLLETVDTCTLVYINRKRKSVTVCH